MNFARFRRLAHKSPFRPKKSFINVFKSHPTASLLLRISVDNNESDSFAPSSGALDIDWHSLLESAKNNKMNIVGISFDLGDSIEDIKMIEIAISKVFLQKTQFIFYSKSI